MCAFVPAGASLISHGRTPPWVRDVLREQALDPPGVEPLGGAIAPGHTPRATRAFRTATLAHAMRGTGSRYGVASM